MANYEIKDQFLKKKLLKDIFHHLDQLNYKQMFELWSFWKIFVAKSSVK